MRRPLFLHRAALFGQVSLVIGNINLVRDPTLRSPNWQAMCFELLMEGAVLFGTLNVPDFVKLMSGCRSGA
ncbi:hypothetical protein [Paraburkholderia youngii]|uniref:hypothetical protein n=1 Tax=Paraburkholderia youngii TaxID=2782701 RepID=UPI003D1DBA43